MAFVIRRRSQPLNYSMFETGDFLRHGFPSILAADERTIYLFAIHNDRIVPITYITLINNINKICRMRLQGFDHVS